jgi:FkbM family methyltransferase
MISYSYVNRLQSPSFLVIGAMDGISHDNLSPYIRDKKMKGVFVEPVKYMFNKLVDNYKDFDGIFFENCAISDNDGEAVIKRIDFDRKDSYPDWSDGGSSLVPQKTDMKNVSNLIDEVVTTKTLKSLLSTYDDLKIDILQIDCEGYDVIILRQFDFKKYNPSFVSIENLSMTNEEKEETIKILTSNNYAIYDNRSEFIATK